MYVFLTLLIKTRVLVTGSLKTTEYSNSDLEKTKTSLLRNLPCWMGVYINVIYISHAAQDHSDLATVPIRFLVLYKIAVVMW